MNKYGYSVTKWDEYDIGKYEVVPLSNGKNPLTGTTHYKFTCVELEVFALR